jgi:predicted DNA-binding transcriptional regulator AlpA
VRSDRLARVEELLARAVTALEAGQAEGLAATEAAAFVGVSISKFRELDANGLIPSPARLGDGNCPRWSRTELGAWFRAGAPSRLRWTAMRDSVLKRAG